MFMLLSQFAKRQFMEGSRPSLSTLRRWIAKGYLPGRWVAGHYYVDYAEFVANGNQLIAKVLKDID